jgi:hypothetical protein
MQVKRSDLVVQIAGGNRLIGSATPLSLTAASSYDPDYRTTALNYTWSCVLGGDKYGSSCGLTSTASTRQATYSPGRLPAKTYIFSVTATSPDGRSGSAAVTITVGSHAVPPFLQTAC